MRPRLAEARFARRRSPAGWPVALPLVLVARPHGPLLLRAAAGSPSASSRERRAAAAHDPEDLEGRDDPVAGGRVLEDDDVAALLAAEAGARDLHPLEDVLVADRRPDDLAAGRLDGRLQPAVREHGDDERRRRAARRARAGRGRGCPRTWSPSTTLAGRVHRDEPVGVAVEGEPDVGAARRRPPRASEAGRGRAATRR